MFTRLDPDDFDHIPRPVIAVANLHDLLAFAGESAELVTHRDRLLAYRASYGSGPSN